MAKPQITTKSSKQLALTYDELDQNFINLRDATIGFTVGSSTANIDLNSALTVTAGTNVTLTLNTETKTLTINSQGGVQSVSGTAGRISSTGGDNPILDLVTTGVTAGSYTASNLTVDSFGRITSISSGVSAQNVFQTVNAGGTNLIADSTTDTLTLTAGTGVAITGNAATDTATFALAQLSPSPAGTYGNPAQIPVVTVDAFGRVTSIGVATAVADIFNTYSVTAVTDSIDLRNGTASTLLGTVRKTMVFKCAPSSTNVSFRLPNFQNMGGQYGEFTFVFVPNLDVGTRTNLPLSGGTITQIVLNTQLDNNITHRWTSGLSDATGAPGAPSSQPGTLNGTTTISGGQVVTTSIPAHYGQIGFGSPYSYENEIIINVQAAPSGGTNAVLKPIFNGNIIDRVEIVNPGSGYTTAPTFTITSTPQFMILNAYDTLILKARFMPSINMTNASGIVNMWILEKIMLKSR
jgi:hypothetical protein